MNRYWSDLHLDHQAIIPLCQRPFPSLEWMISQLCAEWFMRSGETNKLYCLGDVALGLQDFVTEYRPKVFALDTLVTLATPESNVLIAGNHDSRVKSPEIYERLFGQIVGLSGTWKQNTLIVEDEYLTSQGEARPVKLLLSHVPQRDLQGCDYNLFGHIHNLLLRNPHLIDTEFEWMYPRSVDCRYFNVSVEVIGYAPKSFAELYDMRHRMGLLVL